MRAAWDRNGEVKGPTIFRDNFPNMLIFPPAVRAIEIVILMEFSLVTSALCVAPLQRRNSRSVFGYLLTMCPPGYSEMPQG